MNPYDETFIPNAEMERRFPGVTVWTRMIFDLVRAGQQGQAALDVWGAARPATVPQDFDHRVLRGFGLPCGRDESPAHYVLLQETGGWRIHKVATLVTFIEERIDFEGRIAP